MQSIFQYIGMKGMNGQSDPARTADPIRSVDALPALSVCAKSPARKWSLTAKSSTLRLSCLEFTAFHRQPQAAILK